MIKTTLLRKKKSLQSCWRMGTSRLAQRLKSPFRQLPHSVFSPLKEVRPPELFFDGFQHDHEELACQTEQKEEIERLRIELIKAH